MWGLNLGLWITVGNIGHSHIVGVEDYNIWFFKYRKKIGREGQQKDEVFKFHIFFI